MARSLDELFPLLRIELPGIPEPVLAAGVLNAAEQFFQKSEAWRFTIATLLDWTIALTFPVIAAGAAIPAGTRLHRVDTLKYASDGLSLKKIVFRERGQLDKEFSDWEVVTGSTPLRWTNDFPNGARIIPIATADKLVSLQLRVILLPLNVTQAVIPDPILTEFEEVIRNGALARLMKIPGKDWTNLSGASAYAGLFTTGAIKARSRARADYGQPAREVAYGGI